MWDGENHQGIDSQPGTDGSIMTTSSFGEPTSQLWWPSFFAGTLVPRGKLWKGLDSTEIKWFILKCLHRNALLEWREMRVP